MKYFLERVRARVRTSIVPFVPFRLADLAVHLMRFPTQKLHNFHSTPRAPVKYQKELITRSRLSESICQWICTRLLFLGARHRMLVILRYCCCWNMSMFCLFYQLFFILSVQSLNHMHISRARQLFRCILSDLEQNGFCFSLSLSLYLESRDQHTHYA